MATGELKLWTDGIDTYVAESVEHAMALQKAHSGDNPSAADEWTEDTSETLTLDVEGRGDRVTKTRAEWIAKTGPGMLCSTEW